MNSRWLVGGITFLIVFYATLSCFPQVEGFFISLLNFWKEMYKIG